MALASLGLARFYRQAYLSVTDFYFYRSVFQQPLRLTFLYLLYLCSHVAILLTLIYPFHYGERFLEFAQWAETNLPPIEVVDGLLGVEADLPLMKRYEGEPQLTFLFDLDATLQDAQRFRGWIFLFSREQLHIQNDGQSQSYRWKDLGDFRMGRSEIQSTTLWLQWAYFPFAYSFLLVYSFVAKLLLAGCICLFGLSASARYGVRLPLRNYLTIGVYSLTPAVVLDLGVSLTGLQIGSFYLIYFATAALYSYMATQRCIQIDSDGPERER